MHPSDLPRLEISAVNADCGIGRFDTSPWMGEGWIGYVYAGEGRFIRGRFRDIDASSRTCSFYPDDTMQVAGLRPNLSYPYLDGYWGERAKLVLDERRTWQRRQFEPSDSMRYQTPDGGSMVTKSSAGALAGGEIIEGGWDHEHCDICWETISQHDQPVGYFSPPGNWICEQCYTSYVVPRSLAFIRTA